MIRCSLASVLVLLVCLSAGAVTLEKLSLDEMVASSTLIVRGTVRGATSMTAAGLIVTEYEIEASEYYKGSSNDSIRVRLPGGRLDGESQVFAGVPSLHKGEEYVFFLWRGSSGNLQLVGLSQGLLRMRLDGARAVASRPAIDGILLDRRSGLPVRDSGMAVRPQELRDAVRRAERSKREDRQ